MLLHFEHIFETAASPEAVGERVMAAQFATSGTYGISYLPERGARDGSVILRATRKWKASNTPRVELQIEPTAADGHTVVRLSARLGTVHRRFGVGFTAFVLLLMIAGFLIGLTSKDGVLCMCSICFGGIMLGSFYAFMRYYVRRYSGELFHQIEHAVKGEITYR